MPRRKTEAAEAPKSVKAAPRVKPQDKQIEEAVVIQYGSSEWDLTALKEKIFASYVAEGHRRGNVKKLTLYVKPEERKVYYVINDKASGAVDFN